MLHEHIPDSVAFDMSQLLVISILVQINSRPTAEERQSTINRPKAAIMLELLKSLFLGATQNGTQERQELDTLRITTKLTLGELANLSDVLGYHGGTVACDKDGLGMLCCKSLSGLGCSRLQDYGRALRTRLGKMRSRYIEVLALMVNLSDA